MKKFAISIVLGSLAFPVSAYDLRYHYIPQSSGIDSFTATINEAMEIEPLEDSPQVFVEVEWVPATRYEPDKVEVVSADSEIAEQLVLKWGAEIHCNHRIKSLEVDHPSYNVGAENNETFFETLTQSLPTQSPFKQGLIGTFNAQSYHISQIKQACIDMVESGDIDLDPPNLASQSFLLDPDDAGNGANSLFLRGQCSTASGDTITTAFDAPGVPGGVRFSSPPLEVFCHDRYHAPLKLGPKINVLTFNPNYKYAK